jgi:hypothetical protein
MPKPDRQVASPVCGTVMLEQTGGAHASHLGRPRWTMFWSSWGDHGAADGMMMATMPSMRTIRPSSFRRSTAQSRFSTVSFARPPQPSIASRAFPGPVPGIVEEAELILELIQELLRLILHELGDLQHPRRQRQCRAALRASPPRPAPSHCLTSTTGLRTRPALLSR